MPFRKSPAVSVFPNLHTGEPHGGLEVRLKLLVNTGGNIEIDTRTGEYHGRV
jgi:hypothetical protein